METARDNVDRHEHALLANLSAGRSLSYRALPKNGRSDDSLVAAAMSAVAAIVDLDEAIGAASLRGWQRPDAEAIRALTRSSFVVANAKVTHLRHAIADAEDRLAASRKRLHMPPLPSDVLGELRARERRDLFFGSDASERAALFSKMTTGDEADLLDALCNAPVSSPSRMQAREVRRTMQEAAQPDVVARHEDMAETITWAQVIFDQLEAALLAGAQTGVVDLRVDEPAVPFTAH